MGSGANGIRAGRAFVELGVDDRLKSGLDKASKQLQDFGAAVTAVGAGLLGIGTAGATGMLAAAKTFADAGSELHDMADRTGASVEALSALSYAAKQSGADASDLEAGLRKVSKSVVAAAEGSESAQEALGMLGLKAQDLMGLSPDKMFEAIGDRISKLPDPAMRTALAMELMGKSGTRLLPMLKDGASGLDAMRKQAQAFGLVVSTEDANAADTLGDAIDLATATVKQLVFQIGAALAPVLTDTMGIVARFVSGAIEWVRNNREVVETGLKVAAVVAAVGGALVVLGTTIAAVGAVIGAAMTIGSALAAAFTTLATLAAGLAAALMSPLGVLVAIAGVGAVMIARMVDWGAVLSALAEKVKDIGSILGTAFDGVKDALVSGDLGLAAEIAMGGVKTAFLSATIELRKWWAELMGSLATTFFEFTAAVAKYLGQFSKIATAMMPGGAAMQGYVDMFLMSQDQGGLMDTLRKNVAGSVEAEKSALDKELADANGKLRDLRKKAADERAAKDNALGFYSNGSDGPPAPMLAEAAAATASAYRQAGLEAQGTFSAFALDSLLGSDSPMKQVAKATEQTAANTKGIYQRLKDLEGVAFE